MGRPTALITGASAGIGREFAKVFAEHGHDVVLVARREAELEAAAAEVRQAYGVKAYVMACDLVPETAAQELFERVEAAGLQVDVLVNNAGMMQVAPFHEGKLGRAQKMVNLNITSLMNLTHWFVRPMVARGHGKILNIASVAAFMPTPTFGVYGATKAFVLSFSESLEQELKGTGVTVTCLCPGFTETDMLASGGGIEGYIPEFMKLDAETVAREGFQACMKGKGVHVDSLTNNLFVQWVRLQPKWLVRNAGGLLTRFLK